jgi:septal ring factor EnvC (AmiA/AmiB activator)
MGCGKGVYVAKDHIERAVIDGVKDLLESKLDPDRIAKMVNKELAQSGDQDRSKAIQKEISAVETKIANVRKAIEDGLGDTAWANQRLVELQGQLQELENSKPKKRAFQGLRLRTSDGTSRTSPGSWNTPAQGNERSY